MTENRPTESQYSNKDKYIIILIILVVLLIGVVGYFSYVFLFTNPKEPSKDASAYVGTNAPAWDDGIDEPEDTQGKILIPGYSAAQMKAGEKQLKLSIGNPKENRCYLKATLKLENGTVLYESDLLKPGTGYEQIELNQTLEEGTYQAIVHYQGYAMKDQAELNSCNSAFVLTVIQ